MARAIHVGVDQVGHRVARATPGVAGQPGAAALLGDIGLPLASLALLIVTVAVNIMANFVAPAFVLSNLAPKYLNFRRAGLISAFVAVLILPWNLKDEIVAAHSYIREWGGRFAVPIPRVEFVA